MQCNLQSYFTKFTNLKLILSRYHSACISLQESFIKDRNTSSPIQYQLYKSKIVRNDGCEKGAAILVHKSVEHEEKAVRTTLQAVAVSVFIGKLYIVCSVYLPHHAMQSIL